MTEQASPAVVLQYREVSSYQNEIGEWESTCDEWTDFEPGETLWFSGPGDVMIETRVKP